MVCMKLSGFIITKLKFWCSINNKNLLFHPNIILMKVSYRIANYRTRHQVFRCICSFSHMTYAVLACGWSGRTIMLLWLGVLTGEHANYSQIINKLTILTFHSIYDYFALLKAFNTNTPNFHQYFKDKLSSHQPSHICTTPGKEK